MIKRKELVQEIADLLVHQLQLIGPTPTKAERVADAVDMATETSDPPTSAQLETYVEMSRDVKPGSRPSATLGWYIREHLQSLFNLGVPVYREWQLDGGEHNSGCDVVAKAMLEAKNTMKELGKTPDHVRLPITYDSVCKYAPRLKPGD